PAAIGAAIARPYCKVVAGVGDGGLQMTAEELVVAAVEKLPIAFIVVNNRRLGLVRQMQKEEFNGRCPAVAPPSPDFVLLARAHGLKGVRVSDPVELDAAVDAAVRAKRPVLVDVLVDPEADV
ncbi:MAG: acetolactate synthase large subunit, partial [Kiritimatiellae bacterium]|nr:acetolactate synthase large subunit [Kiritimatiellia bacterium]